MTSVGSSPTAHNATIDDQIDAVIEVTAATDGQLATWDAAEGKFKPKPGASTGADVRPAWRRVFPVGPTRTYTTLAAAVTAARLDMGGWGGEGVANPDTNFMGIWKRGGRPAFWRTAIVVDPGAYAVDTLFLGSGIDLVGATDKPADVVITANSNQNYAVSVFGSFYMSGVTLVKNSGTATGNMYPIHMTSEVVDGPGNQGRYTQIVENCILENNDPAAAASIGCDLAPEALVMLRGNRLDSASGASNNIHPIAGALEPATAMFIDNVVSHNDLDLNFPSASIPDACYVWGNKLLDGTPIADKVFMGTATISPLTFKPALPVGGMTQRERARYYPTIGKLAPRKVAPDYPDLVPVTLVANREYYVPLFIKESLLVDKQAVLVTTAAGTAQGGYRPMDTDDGLPKALDMSVGTAVTAALGLMTNWAPAAARPTFLECGMKMYLQLKLSDAGCQVLGSTRLSSLVTCYYRDGGTGTFNVVAAGDPVPWLALVTK